MVDSELKKDIKQFDKSEFIDKTTEMYKQLNTPEQHSGVQLFFSFDIVNSSHFKEVASKDWAFVIVDIIKSLCYEVRDKIPFSVVWRIIGDEVVFVVEVNDNQILFEYINDIYYILYVKSPEIINRCQIDDYAKSLLAIQASAWIAYTEERTYDTGSYDCSLTKNNICSNVSTKYEFDDHYIIYEYIGSDIDAGFRISKFTRRMHFCVSYELAYLLAKDKNYLCWLHIISYEQLKGVWDGKWYPIIWYHNEDIAQKSFLESFKYYEPYDDELIKCCFSSDYRQNKFSFLSPVMFTDVKKALEIIKKDCMCSRINVIEQHMTIDSGENWVLCRDNYDEFHIAVVCFDENIENVFVAWNEKHKRWEFGCCDSEYHSSLLDVAITGYKKTFGISIDLIMHKLRQDPQPIPVAIYSIQNNSKIKKGIILTGTFSGNPITTERYSKFKILPIDQVDDFVAQNSDNLVNDFKNSIDIAYKILKEGKNDNGYDTANKH